MPCKCYWDGERMTKRIIVLNNDYTESIYETPKLYVSENELVFMTKDVETHIPFTSMIRYTIEQLWWNNESGSVL